MLAYDCIGSKHLPLTAGGLRPLVRVRHHSELVLSPPDVRNRGLQRKVGRQPRLRGAVAQQRFAGKPRDCPHLEREGREMEEDWKKTIVR